MAFQPVPNTALAVVEIGSDTLQWTNALHFYKNLFTVQDMENLGGTLWYVYETYFMPMISTTFSLRKVTVYDLREYDGYVYTYESTPVAGSDAGQLLPIQDALVVTLYTIHRGRSGRGRVYLAGFTESDLTGGVFNAGVITAANTMFTSMKASLSPYGWSWVIVQRWHDKVKLAEGQAHDVQTHTVRSGIPGNQQRRGRRP